MKNQTQSRRKDGPITKGIKALLADPPKDGIDNLQQHSVPDATAPIRFEMLSLDLIDPDPKQPRTIFKDDEMSELTDSIRERGVLQPILVRPHGDRYLVVCGERRYRACLRLQSMFETKSTIPATIREISDDEAFEIQIIENLQRKDIEPMEEAVAYKSIVDSRQFSVEDLAVKVAKSKKYVAQRITLAQLIPDFQEMLSVKALTLAGAFKLSRLSAEFQADVLKFHLRVVKNWRENPDFKFVEFDHYINVKMCSLHEAKFDPASEALPPIACTTCAFNSANQPLLFADMEKPTCSRPACFANKTEVAFLEKINTVKQLDGSDVLLFDDGWYEANTKLLAKQFEPQGFKVVGRDKFENITKPDNPGTFEEFFENEYFGNGDEDDARKQYQEELAQYEADQAAFEAEICRPDVMRALVASGSERGEIIYIKPKELVQKGGVTTPKHSKPMPSRVSLLLEGLKSADLTTVAGTKSDKLLALLFGWRALSHVAKEKILSEKFGITDSYYYYESYHGSELIDKLQELTLEDWKVYERISLLSSSIAAGSAEFAVIEALAEDANITIEEPMQTED